MLETAEPNSFIFFPESCTACPDFVSPAESFVSELE